MHELDIGEWYLQSGCVSAHQRRQISPSHLGASVVRAIEVRLLVGELQHDGEVVDSWSPPEEVEVCDRNDVLHLAVNVVVPGIAVHDLTWQVRPVPFRAS